MRYSASTNPVVLILTAEILRLMIQLGLKPLFLLVWVASESGPQCSLLSWLQLLPHTTWCKRFSLCASSPFPPGPNMVDALSSWSSGHGNPPPSGIAACVQKTWDAYKISSSMDSLLQNAPHDLARARLLAVSAKESGAWLNALPSSSLGLRMDDDTIRVAVGLRLGSVLCCDVEVDQLGLHGLSCKKREGRHYTTATPP